MEQCLVSWEEKLKGKYFTYLINVIIMMAKFHIHECKFTDTNPCFIALNNDQRTNWILWWLLLYGNKLPPIRYIF